MINYSEYTYIERVYLERRELDAPQFRYYVRIHLDWNLQS